MATAKQAPRSRTQAERSAETRDRLIGVTLDLLCRTGLRATTTSAVTQAAGVSRGALLHHFPTKEALLKEALRVMLRRETDSIRAMAEDIECGRLDPDGFLDALWEKFSGPLFMVTLEYVTAARTDPAIRAALTGPAYEFNAMLDEIWELVFTGSALPPGERRRALTATLCFLRGLGVQSVWRDDPTFFDEMTAYWKLLMRGWIGTAAREGNAP